MHRVHKVRLMFTELGILQPECYDDWYGFDPFWNNTDIFHDVFEHWFEFKHKYFMGSRAMCQAGEIAASGATFYYVEGLSLHERIDYLSVSHNEAFINTDASALEEAVRTGIAERFDAIIETDIPYIPEVEEVDDVLVKAANELIERVLDTEIRAEDPDDRAYAEKVKASMKFSEIIKLYRWGFNMAQKLIPDNMHNRDACADFIHLMDKFTGNNYAYELNQVFEFLDVSVYRDGDNIKIVPALIPLHKNNPKVFLKDWNCTHILEEYRYKMKHFINVNKIEI